MSVYDPDAASVDKPALTPGRPITVWAEEQPLGVSPPAPDSQQISLHRVSHDYQGLAHTVAVEIEFAEDPGDFQIDLQTADTDEDKYYVTKVSVSQANMNEQLVARIEAVNIVAKFARLHMASCTNNVDVTARVS